MTRKPTPRLRKFLLILGGSFAGLFLAELVLRIIGFGLGTDSAFRPDPYCGARHVPNYRGWHTKEGHVWIQINSHGFRDRERTLEKPSDTYRIALLGDSFSEAFQVDLDKTFWSVMERKLAKNLQSNVRRVEVLNFGVSGYGTAQELEMLRHYVWEYDPDLVMLQFLASNDVRNNSKKLDEQTGRPFYTLKNEQLVLDDSFLQDPQRVRFQTSAWIKLKHFFVENSRIGALVYQLRHQKQAKGIQESDEAGLSLQAFREPTRPEWQEAWEVTDRLVVEIAKEVKDRDKQFVVLLANTGVEVDPDDSVRVPLLKQLGVSDLLYPQRRLETLGTSHGFPVIHLMEAMRAYSKEHRLSLHGFSNTRMGTGHWNETGHRLAGALAATRLIESGLGPFKAKSSSKPEQNRRAINR